MVIHMIIEPQFNEIDGEIELINCQKDLPVEIDYVLFALIVVNLGVLLHANFLPWESIIELFKERLRVLMIDMIFSIVGDIGARH
jgi:hypothetical protein